MSDYFSKILLVFLVIVSVIVGYIVTNALIDRNRLTQQCTERAGVVIKTENGWQCADVKIIK